MSMTRATGPTVFVVDDDDDLRCALRQMLDGAGLPVECYPGGESFLAAYGEDRPGCLLLDVAMPGMSGLEVQQALKSRRSRRGGWRYPSSFSPGTATSPWRSRRPRRVPWISWKSRS